MNLFSILSSYRINYYSFTLLKSIIAFQLLLTLILNDIKVLYLENNITLFYDIKISIYMFKIIAILILIIVIVGFLPRIMGVLHFLVTFLFYKSCIFIDGGDQLSTNLTFIIFPLTFFDGNLNHWNNKLNVFEGVYSKPFSFFTFWLLCIQISVVYLHSSIGKLSVNEWSNGTALWYWVNHESFGASSYVLKFLKFILSNSFVVFTLNWSVIIVELIIAMLLFVPKNNLLVKIICVLGILFHIGVIIIHGIFSFSIVMIGCLIFYFQINFLSKWNSKFA